MSNPSEPLARIASIKAPEGIDSIELRSALTFLHSGDKAAFLAHLAVLADTVIDTDGTLAANSDAKVASQKATRTYVAAQLAALIASAPGALDTLNELAAALGNDADFAATITNAIAAKQDVLALTEGMLSALATPLNLPGGLARAETVLAIPIPWQSSVTLTKTTSILSPAILQFIDTPILIQDEDTFAFSDGTTTWTYEVDFADDGAAGDNIPIVISSLEGNGNLGELFEAIIARIAADTGGVITGSSYYDEAEMTTTQTFATAATGPGAFLSIDGAGGTNAAAFYEEDDGEVTPETPAELIVTPLTLENDPINASDGSFFTFTVNGESVTYELDINDDGVTEGRIALSAAEVPTGSTAEVFSAIADRLSTDLPALTGDWMDNLFTVTTVAVGWDVTLTLHFEGNFDENNQSAVGAGGLTGTPQAVVAAVDGGKRLILSGIMVANTGAVPWTRPLILSWHLPGVELRSLLVCPAPEANGVITLAGMTDQTFELICSDAGYELIVQTDTAGDTLPEEAGDDLKIIAFGFTIPG